MRRDDIPIENFISRALHRLGWSDGDLAQRSGLSRSKVNLIKNRRVRPRLRDALLIVKALGLPLAEVFRLEQHSAACVLPRAGVERNGDVVNSGHHGDRRLGLRLRRLTR